CSRKATSLSCRPRQGRKPRRLTRQRLPRLPPECLPCSTLPRPSARMGTGAEQVQARRHRARPTGNRKGGRKRCADLAVRGAREIGNRACLQACRKGMSNNAFAGAGFSKFELHHRLFMVYEIIVEGKPHRLELARAAAGWEC